MGQSAEELRRDIEQTRNGLGNTMEAIGDRVSPSRMMERRKNRFRNGVQHVVFMRQETGPNESRPWMMVADAVFQPKAGEVVSLQVIDPSKAAPDQQTLWQTGSRRIVQNLGIAR